MMAEGPNSSPSLEGGSKVEGITSTSTSTCDSTQSKRDNSDFNGSVFLITSEGKTLNLPIPANDSHDPLNWTSKKRAISFATLLIFSTVSLVTVLGPSMMFESLAKDFPPEESEPFQVTLLLSAPSLFQGIASFLWIPLSLAVGRRPVLLLAALTLLVATIWAAFSTTFGSLLAAVCVVGVVQGAAMSVVFLIVIDLTFIHQRPLAIAMVWSFAGCVSPATLSLSQALHPGREWRNFYLISIIPSSISLALIYFLFTETYFTRPAVAFDGHIVVQSAAEDVKIYNGWEQVPGATGARDTPQNPDQGVWKWTTKELKFWGKTRGGWNAMFACYPQILLCLLNPLVFWVTLLQAAIFGSMLILGQTYVQVLQSEPYFLPAYAIDLVNLARALGSVLAWPGAGLMVVRITRKLAMSNKGVRDAEHYLPAFILPIITSALSLILYGLTAQHKWHWIWVYISYVLSAFSFSAMATASSLNGRMEKLTLGPSKWITEAFPRWAAPAMVVVSGISYIASFGIAFSIHPWVESQGYSGAGMEMAWIILVVGLIGVPIAFWGKKLRQYIDGKWAFNEMGALRPQ